MQAFKYLLGISLIFFFYSCEKEVVSIENQTATENQFIDSQLDRRRLQYRDSLVFLRYSTTNHFISPTSRPSAAGYFRAIPKGLAIDSATGRINIRLSETGIRYKIYYASFSNIKIDSFKLVISGIDYRDGIFEIARTPNTYDTSFPIYNARPELVLPCGDDDDDGDGDIDDDDNTCVFDETDLNNDGNDDIAGVIQDKLLVDIKKGTIDLEASYYAGVFGSGNPANGVSRDFTFYYRLQDASNRALNKITVRLYHYRRRTDIPQALLDTLSQRIELSSWVNSRHNSVSDQIGSNTYADDQQSTSVFQRLSLAYRPKRPPIIIIISQ